MVALDGARTWLAYQNQIAESAQETDNLVRSLAEHVGDAIQSLDTDLAGVKQRAEAEGLGADAIDRLRATLLAQVATTRRVHAFYIFDATGRMLTNTVRPTDTSINNADRDYFAYWQTHREDHAFVGGPYRSRVDGTWTLSISRRIDTPDGRFGGVVSATIALDVFKEYYARFEIGEHGILLLTRDDGTMVVRRPFDESYIGRKAAARELFEKMIPAAPAGHFDGVSQIDGVMRLSSYRQVPNYPLVVIAGLDRGEVLADWQSEARAHAFGVLLMVVIVVLLGLRLTAKIADDGRQIDDRLRQSEKMEVIGRLAAGVAHDFNNILQVIMGGMEILGDEAALSSQGRTFVHEVENAAARGSQLTHHLLSYSRKQVLSPQLLEPADILEGLRLVLSRTLRGNIAVVIAVEPGIGFIEADPSQLQTALINLALNAEHAMPEGGTLRCDVRVATTHEDSGELKRGRYVVIAVSDSGVGMAPDVLAMAFDPFFTTKGLEGSGLGLPMVQGFSRQSGGDVRVRSAQGEGTSVEIWLPAVAVAATIAVEAGPPVVRSGRVLLVDDSPDVLLMVEASLRKGGFTVHKAGNGYEALAALANGEQFDVLVTDYMMPGLNGLALIKEARTFQADLPALIISGFADATGSQIDLPDTAFLRKPFQRDQLLARVSALLAETDQELAEPTS